MPYRHKGCGGLIKWYPPFPIPPRCTECKKRWSPFVLYSLTPRKDMHFELKPPKIKVKGQTKYANWGNRVPFISTVASRLPNWPRWARVLSFLLFISIIFVVMYWIFGGFSG